MEHSSTEADVDTDELESLPMIDMSIPTLGRHVLYVSHGSPDGQYPKTDRVAIVVELVDGPNPNGLVGLCVLSPTGMFFNRNVPYDGSKDPAGGTWHWPDR